MNISSRCIATILLWGTVILSSCSCEAFVPSFNRATCLGRVAAFSSKTKRNSSTQLRMGLDLVTYLRTEWVSAALCTNQTPKAADVCLQLGTEDGRAVTFIPRTIQELITSSAEADGTLTVSAERQLRQQRERRRAASITFSNQRADDLKETEDASVDVVISLQAAERMRENGLDWKRSIREAGRVLKPGGRLLFVEQTEIGGESYLEYIQKVSTMSDDEASTASENDGEEVGAPAALPVFEEVGFDVVDMVLVPHIAGVAIKSANAGISPEEAKKKEAAEEKAKRDALSIAAFERGIKKKRKRKKAAREGNDEASSE